MKLPSSTPKSRTRMRYITHDLIPPRAIEIMERVITLVEDVIITDSESFEWSTERDFRGRTIAAGKCMIPYAPQPEGLELAFSMSSLGVTIESVGRNTSRNMPPMAFPWCLLDIPREEVADTVVEFRQLVSGARGEVVPSKQLILAELGFALSPDEPPISTDDLDIIRKIRNSCHPQTPMVHFPANCFLVELTALFSL